MIHHRHQAIYAGLSQRWRRAQICHADALSVRRIASMRVPARARCDFYIPCRPSCVILFIVDLPLCSRSHVMFRCLAPNRHATQYGHVQGTQVGHWHQEGAGRATGYKERKMRSAGCCGREVRGELCSPCARCAGCRCVRCMRDAHWPVCTHYMYAVQCSRASLTILLRSRVRRCGRW